MRITNLSRECIYPSLNDLKYVAIPLGDSEGVRTALRAGDILISITADIGAVGLVTPAIELPAYVNQHIALVRIAKEQADVRYLAYFLAGAASQRRFKAMTDAGAKAGMNLNGIRQVLAAFPPTTAEQQAIAEALADADALVESLLLLLAKKRQIKQGAMQELLTGKRRLPGFHTLWKRSQLGTFLSVRHGRSQKLVECESGTYPILASGGRIGWASQFLHDKPSVLIGRKGTIDEPRYMETPFWSVDTLFYTEIRHPNVAKFLFYRFCLIDWMRHNEASGVPSLNAKVIESIEIDHPESDEQQAIADALSDMDAEIDGVEGRLEKAHDIKQAMMQEMLTGRIRLVQPRSNVIPLPINLATSPPAPQSAHNWQINEAVVIGVLAHRFGNEKFPLPRKRRVKLMYLLHRHAEGRAEGYLKKAAGPYDPNTKYKGPEAIALKNGYVRAVHNGTYEGFVGGDKSDQAQRYFDQWYGMPSLDWLERFHYRKTDDLELLATVDMAMVDLAAAGQPANLVGVKRVIAAHPEWVPKLSRELFSDDRIAGAIAECQVLFGG